MLARLSAFVIWAFVAGAAMFWGLRLLVRPSPVPSNVVAVSESSGVRGDLSRLLGAEAAPVAEAAPAVSTRFRLLGVMAGKATNEGRTPGVALISIDGKPARTFGAGARVDDEMVVQSLGLRTVSIGPLQGPAAFVLEVPPLSAAATGTLAAPASMSSSQQEFRQPPSPDGPPGMQAPGTEPSRNNGRIGGMRRQDSMR